MLIELLIYFVPYLKQHGLFYEYFSSVDVAQEMNVIRRISIKLTQLLSRADNLRAGV